LSRTSSEAASAPTETLDVRTADGWSLRVDLRAPRGAPAGVAILAHALMARRTEFDRPSGRGFGSFLSERGWHVASFDFRGHGDSAPTPREGGTFGYDDLVAKDLPAVSEFARSEIAAGLPLVVVGHSLGGHAALAAQASGAIDVDAIVALGATMWLRRLDPSRVRWGAKRATVEGMLGLARRIGYFPARRLRLGSDDIPLTLLEDVARTARSGAWTSADGRVDYWAALPCVRVPVLQVLSEGDRFECDPASGTAFAAACGSRCTVVRVGQSDDGGPAPSHMGLVTSGALTSVRTRIEEWMRGACGRLSASD
jgi:predicted alpha/beta hydrolase